MMKRMLVVLAMVPVMARAHDLSVGTIEISGKSNLGFDASTDTLSSGTTTLQETKLTRLGVGTSGLYYVTPQVGVGFGIAYDSTTYKYDDGAKDELSTLVIGPQVGLDFPVAESVSLFADVGIGYASAHMKSTSPAGFVDADDSLSGLGFTLGGGLKYFVTHVVSLDAGLDYTYVKVTGDNLERKTSGIGLNFGLSVYLGGK